MGKLLLPGLKEANASEGNRKDRKENHNIGVNNGVNAKCLGIAKLREFAEPYHQTQCLPQLRRGYSLRAIDAPF